MIAVRFLMAWGPYNAGEIAGFEAPTVNRLKAAGVAVEAGGVEEAAPPVSADADVDVAPIVASPVAEPAQRRGRPRKG